VVHAGGVQADRARGDFSVTHILEVAFHFAKCRPEGPLIELMLGVIGVVKAKEVPDDTHDVPGRSLLAIFKRPDFRLQRVNFEPVGFLPPQRPSLSPGKCVRHITGF
jgi:hypothetical protein